MKSRNSIFVSWVCLMLIARHGVNGREIPRKIQQQDLSNEVLSHRSEEFGFQSLISLGIKVLPLVLNLVTGGDGPSSSDRIEDIDLKDEDPLSWQNVLSTGIKVVLALLSNSSDGIDKSDTTPTQAVLGTVISAVTGSDDPSEVATMAKQANEVINLMMTLVEALQTSFSS